MIIGAFGTITKNLEKKKWKLEIQRRIETAQYFKILLVYTNIFLNWGGVIVV